MCLEGVVSYFLSKILLSGLLVVVQHLLSMRLLCLVFCVLAGVANADVKITAAEPAEIVKFPEAPHLVTTQLCLCCIVVLLFSLRYLLDALFII